MTDLTWAISSCALLLALIALRAVFGSRMKPGLRYALWGLALLRLLLPIQLFSAPWGVSAELPDRAAAQEIDRPAAVSAPLPAAEPGTAAPVTGTAVQPRPSVEIAATPEKTAEPAAEKRSLGDILLLLWKLGACVTAALFLFTNLRFRLRLRARRRPLEVDCPLRVCAVENLASSCLLGNTVYVSAETAEDETKLRHVLAHELSHHRHGDHIWVLLRCAALALHWYDPAAWWAAALSRQDSELWADAGALARLGEEERESYGETLIQLSTRRARRVSLLCTATAMTNGKRSLRERVRMIAKKPRMTAAVLTAVLLLAAAAAGCAFAGAEKEPAVTPEPGASAPVTQATIDRNSLFTGVTLPENCENNLQGQLYCPENAAIYGTSFARNRDDLLSALLGDSPEKLSDGVYQSGYSTLNCQFDTTIRLRDNGIMPILEAAFPVTAQAGDTEGKKAMGVSKENYGSGDLAWLPMDEAAKQVEAFLKSLSVNGIERFMAKTLDPETIRQTLDSLLAYLREEGKPADEREIERISGLLKEAEGLEDGYYFFCYRMVLDDVPVFTAPNTATEIGLNGAEIYCIYGKDGFVFLNMTRVPSTVTLQDSGALIPPETAAGTLAGYLSFDPEAPAIRLEDFYLTYAYQNRDNNALHPTWVLVTSRAWWRDESVRQYGYYMIDAITGERIGR